MTLLLLFLSWFIISHICRNAESVGWIVSLLTHGVTPVPSVNLISSCSLCSRSNCCPWSYLCALFLPMLFFFFFSPCGESIHWEGRVTFLFGILVRKWSPVVLHCGTFHVTSPWKQWQLTTQLITYCSVASNGNFWLIFSWFWIQNCALKSWRHLLEVWHLKKQNNILLFYKAALWIVEHPKYMVPKLRVDYIY